MHIEVLLFGIVADLIGKTTVPFELNTNDTIGDFKEAFVNKYPQLKSYATYAIAINEEYALDDKQIQENDVIAIIPPVSGG